HLKDDSSGSNDVGKRTESLTKFLLLALIPVIGGCALYSYIAGFEPGSSLLGIAIALGAVVIMPVLWVRKRKIGRETNCSPLSMDAVQSATCFLMALALLGGLLINYLFRIGWVDYVATAVILVFVARESVEAFRGMNPAPPKVPDLRVMCPDSARQIGSRMHRQLHRLRHKRDGELPHERHLQGQRFWGL